MISLDTVFTAGVHQDGSTDDICLKENLRIFDGTVYMAFCSEVDHDIRMLFLKETVYCFTVCDAFLHKTEIRIVHDRGKSGKITRIGQAVQADDPVVRVFV